MALRRLLALLLLLVLLTSCGRGFFTTSSPGVEPEPPPGDPTDTGPVPEATPAQTAPGA